MKKAIVMLACMSMLFACHEEKEQNVLYTTCYASYDLTKRIVKDHFSVINLTPAGSEPHDFEPTAKTMGDIHRSKGLLLNGLGLEHWADSIPNDLKEKTFVVSKDIKTLSIEERVDPHIWLSIPNAIKEMENIKDYLSLIDSENKEDYQTNFETEKEKFLRLDATFRKDFETLDNKYLVVSHAAFGYLCNEYKLEQIYVSGLSLEEEPTAKDLERIIEKVQEYDINTIFYEEFVSPEISLKIAEETGCKTEVLNPLESLSEEELKSKDYLSLMMENHDKIMEANNG